MPQKKNKNINKKLKNPKIEYLKRLNNWLRFSVFAADGIAILSWIIFKYDITYLIAVIFLVLIARIGALLYISGKYQKKK